jgi:uncharacterized membrane protein YgcG
MKNQIFQIFLLVIIVFTMSVFFAPNLLAQDYAAGKSGPSVAQAARAGRTAPQLSYGMPQVLQLAHAKISDSTIIAYIQNSGTVYNLDASQIVYLKQQGVSDAVIAAMINQRSRVSAAALDNTAPPTSGQTAAVVAQPATSYVQTVPSSTAYVVPDTQSYYYYSPYYYPYYGYYWWPYPVVSFSFGYGGGYWGGYHGGYHHGGGGGGYRGGGGYHGGGGHHH